MRTLFAVAALSLAALPALALEDAWSTTADGGYAVPDDAYSDTTFDTYDVSGVDPIYSAPDSGQSSYTEHHAFIPDDAYFEYFGNMGIKGMPGNIRMTNAFISLPLWNPAAHQWKGWSFDAKLSLRQTWLDGSGADELDVDHLTTVGLNASVSHALGRASRVAIGAVPNFSSDFDNLSSDDFFWGCYAAFSSKLNSRFSYTVGVAVMPDYYDNCVLPLINFRWNTNGAWNLILDAARLSYENHASEHFHWGPFAQWSNGMWTVRREARTEQVRINCLVLGIGCNGYLTLGRTKVTGLLDVGSAVHNEFRVKDKRGDHTLEKFHARPGLYVRAGIKLAF